MSTASKCARRSGQAQTVLLGVIFFCVPGMWNAITSMAGGLDSPSMAGAATAAVYGTGAFTSLFASLPCNILGPRVTLFVGTLGYWLYVLSLLMYKLGATGAPLVVAAGAINGCCCGLLWVAHGQLMYTYAGADGRGVLFGLFWLVFSLGAVTGGLLSFGENFDDDSGAQTSVGTFVTFVGLMTLGSCLVGLLESPAHVIRLDGTRPPVSAPVAVCAELRAMGRLLLDRRSLALAPCFIFSNWFYAFQFTCFNARVFDARTQGLNNTFYWGAQMVGTVLFGRWLDAPSVSPRRRALRALVVCFALVALTWILALFMSHSLDLDGEPAPSHTSKSGEAPPPAPPSRPLRSRLDALRSPSEWAAPFAVYVGWGVIDAFVQTYSFWIIGQLDDDPQVLGRFTGIYRCLQSGGAAVSWVLSTLSWDCGGRCAGPVPPTAQAWINIIVGMASLPGTILLAMTLDERPHEKALSASVFTAPDRADGLLAAEPDEADRVRLALPP